MWSMVEGTPALYSDINLHNDMKSSYVLLKFSFTCEICVVTFSEMTALCLADLTDWILLNVSVLVRVVHASCFLCKL